MTIPVNRASTSITAVLVSVTCLVVMVILVAGLAHFLDLLFGSLLQIAVISAVAGIIRLPFRRGGFVLSVVCGASIALAGFLIVLVFSVSSI